MVPAHPRPHRSSQIQEPNHRKAAHEIKLWPEQGIDVPVLREVELGKVCDTCAHT